MQKDSVARSKQMATMAARQQVAQNTPSDKENSNQGRKYTHMSGTVKRKNEDKIRKKTLKEKISNFTKIERLPKNVRESLPFRGITKDGIIETKPGVFTKSYELTDINFTLAPEEEQLRIFDTFKEFLNSFNEDIKWEFTIFNHEIRKTDTVKNIRVMPQKDGLNHYRQDLNDFLLEQLVKGNNSITQSKYLTISIESPSSEVAVQDFKNIDKQINLRMHRVTKRDVKPLTAQERMSLLYQIYNQDFDYRMESGVYDREQSDLDISALTKEGLQIKDFIGPSGGMNFIPRNYFMIGETYARTLYIAGIPSVLKSTLLSDLAETPCAMLLSVTSEIKPHDEAIKAAREKVATLEGDAAKKAERNIQHGYMGALPLELEQAMASARQLLEDLTINDSNMFFTTITATLFANSKEELEKNTNYIMGVSRGRHTSPLKVMNNQMEFAFNTSLPLCRNDIFVEHMLTSDSEATLIPFNSQEITQKDAIFYGLNQSTKNMVLYNRLASDNHNGLIFGMPGSGKSFIAKFEIINVALSRQDSQIFVIDPNGEYTDIVKGLGGEVVKLKPNSDVYLNPLDMDISHNETTDPITMKSDAVLSMLEAMLGRAHVLDPACRTIIDRSVRKIYDSYIKEMNSRTDGVTIDTKKCPTLQDLFFSLREQDNYAAEQLADILEFYTTGSFNTFSNRTTVKTDKKVVSYDISELGTGMKELGLHVCITDIINKMMTNRKKNIYTWFYIDEFHMLLHSDNTIRYMSQVWKMARKFWGIPTGITQNTDDLLKDNTETKDIINNTSFVLMFKEQKIDRLNLMELFSLSDRQIEYITESDRGKGLFYNGKVVLPIELEFPQDNELFPLMDTRNHR